MRRIALCLIGACHALAGGEAHAAAFMMRENSAEAVATVFSGEVSRADSAATVFANPAGMSRLAGTELEAGITLLKPQIRFSGNASLGSLAVPGNNSGDAGEATFVPDLYGSTQVGDRLWLGLAVTEPFVNSVHYDSGWSGRYVATSTLVKSTDINPNFAFALGDHLAVGGGISLQYLSLKLAALIPQFPIFGPGTPDGGYALDSSNWNWGYNFGLLAEPAEGWRLGLTYRSAISHEMAGDLAFSPATRIGFVNAHGHAPIHLPASISLGVTHQEQALSFSGELQLVQWHVLQEVSFFAPPNPAFTFQERYHDSWMFSAGATYQLDPVWNLKAGAGFDQSPVVDTFRDSGVPDKGRIMLGAGAGARLSGSLTLELGYAYYFSSSASMNSSANAVEPITGLTVKGAYDNSQHNVTLGLRARF